MKAAPLFTDSFELCRWLLDHLADQPSVLAQRACNTCLDLLEALTLALKGQDRMVRIDQAEEALILLRIHLRLAERTGLLTESQLLFALQQTDVLGRQLGGWIRALEAL